MKKLFTAKLNKMPVDQLAAHLDLCAKAKAAERARKQRNATEYLDITCRFVRHYGWMYLIVASGIEYARGEFHPTAETALMRGQAMAEKLFADLLHKEAA